jgi:hypothetical protein
MSSEITWPVTFSVEHILRDLLNTKDPVIKKVLREREDAYLNNLAWLEEDLDTRIREEEEKQRLYEDNIAWLDEDLKMKMDQRHKDNITWLDEDLKKKMDQRQKELFSEIESSSPQVTHFNYSPPKIWHCGNGKLQGGPEQSLMNYGRGLDMGTYWICHGTEDDEWTKSTGNNASKQFWKFKSDAQEGDILFLHSSMTQIGGITHWGVFTGEISPAHERGISYIHVYDWIPLPETLKGVGDRRTLYEVKPTYKNYQNYSIPS